MKKVVTFLVAFVIGAQAFSQDSSYLKPPTIGIQFFFNDFKTPAAIRTTSLNATIRDKKLAHFNSMSPGLAINYLRGLTRNLDLSSSLEMSFLDYPIQGKGAFGGNRLLLEATAMVNAKMLPDSYVVVPYLSAGLGVSKYENYYGTIIPMGVGLQVNIFDEAFFFVNSQYRLKVSDNTNYHLFASIGFAGTIGGHK